ncbi:MAG TPA: signal recognition particle protein, partial [Buchnera sp. (in: enterobacteria)]|nr:signal recognition particle protein [Buchnera sp. (in: enterobacteria)]
RYITDKPIKFIGTGEHINDIEPFFPHKIASRILGMGDMLSFIKTIEKQIDGYKDKKSKNKINYTHKFNFNDFICHIQKMKNIGGISKLINKLPQNQIALDNIKSYINDKTLTHFEVIINSMTKKERCQPEIIKGSRKRRISFGSGVTVQEINQLLKKFNEIQRIMKKIKKTKINRILQGINKFIPKY